MKVQSLVKLSGVGDDLVVGTPATVVASGDFVGLDFDRLATNADMFRAYLQRLKSSGSGLVCYCLLYGTTRRWQEYQLLEIPTSTSGVPFPTPLPRPSLLRHELTPRGALSEGRPP